MTSRTIETERRIERSYARLMRFAEQVHALTPDAWIRLELACAPLAGYSARAVLARADILARGCAVLRDLLPHPPLVVNMIADASHVLQLSMAAMFEAAVGLGAIERARPPREEQFEKPRTYRYALAHYLVDDALERNAPRYTTGVAAAVRAAQTAVLYFDRRDSASFRDVYQYLEGEIPAAEIFDAAESD